MASESSEMTDLKMVVAVKKKECAEDRIAIGKMGAHYGHAHQIKTIIHFIIGLFTMASTQLCAVGDSKRPTARLW